MVTTIHVSMILPNIVRLDSDCTVKVSDGALAQQFYPECYYTLFGATRPVRWAAVETLQEGLCTVRSNVVRIIYMYIVDVHTMSCLYNVHCMYILYVACMYKYMYMYMYI